MSFDVAKKFIDDLLSNKYDYLNQDNTKGLIVEFIGGEPFLEIELMTQIAEYLYNQMIMLNHPWLYYTYLNITSNGVLYNTPKVQEYFKRFGYLTHMGISIDGNKQLHDTCRVDINGNGSYDIAIASVKQYRKQFNRDTPTKMTLSPNNIQYLSDAILNLIKENYFEIHLNCAYESGWNVSHAKIMYYELKKVADYLIDNNLYNKIFISLFNENGFSKTPDSETQNWCGGTGDGGNLALDYQGKLYPCIRYMSSSLNNKQEPIYIGDISHGICITQKEKENFEKINNITRQSQSPDECLNCPISEDCGWCSAYNYEETGSVNKRVTYICIMHQARSLANVYYWNKLYKYLNINKHFNMNLPKVQALSIIDELEYLKLQNLSQGA